MKKALISGITGQDGSYLAEYLLSRDYEVHGIIRRTSTENTKRIAHIMKDIHLHYGDLTDSLSLVTILAKVRPDEVYNLGAQSHVRVSFDIPEYTADVTGGGALRMLEAIRLVCPEAKFYQASSSEIFGKVQETPQNEKTPLYPRSPYGCSKAFAHWVTINYRESYDMYAVNGILFNHESPRRGENFVTKKVTRSLVRIKLGLQDKMLIGNMDSKRDWGYAGDYVEAMHLMLQQPEPDDFVIATGETHSVRDLIEIAAKYLDLGLSWQGEGLEEKGYDKKGNLIIEVDPHFFRPAEVDVLLGDANKAKRRLGWEPENEFEDLVKMMIDYDLGKEQING